ncbi:hypothetical protein RFI_30130, partial [Reticulomyxa filosa]
FFYLFFSTVKFPIVQVSPQNNEFEFGKEAQYVIKWLQEFFNGNLKFFQMIFVLHFSYKKNKRCLCVQQDIEPNTMPDLEKATMKQLMEKRFYDITKSSPAHQRSFFKYLHQQFVLLSQLTFLNNQLLEIDKKSMQWRHEITKSVIEMSKILCCRQYNRIKVNTEEKEQKIESNGQEKFYLCEKWRKPKERCFLVNQDGKSISMLISDESQKLRFHLFNLKQDFKKRDLILQEEPELQTEKEKRLRLLFHILGIPDQGTMKDYEEKKEEKYITVILKSLHDQIVDKLCNDEEWSNY